jgi:hypothetical protein
LSVINHSLLWNMNSHLFPSIGPDDPEAVSFLHYISVIKLML